MNIIIHLFSAFAIPAFALAFMSFVAIAQDVTTAPQQRTAKICSFDAVDTLLPPVQNSQSSNSLFSYLATQGFVEKHDGSWVCYVSDPTKDGRYYTLFKVQQVGKKLVGSSFLDGGKLINGQDNRTLNLFMMLVEKHTNTTDGNRQSIRTYLQSFISLVKQGKVPASRRAYLFDQPSCGFVFHPILTEGLQGTAITINLNVSPEQLGCTR